jgi:Protein of unknown function (DUF1579)
MSEEIDSAEGGEDKPPSGRRARPARWRRRGLAIGAALGLGVIAVQVTPALGSSETSSQTETATTAAAARQQPELAPELAAMEDFLGTWRCTLSYPNQEDPEGPPIENTLISRVHPVMDGTWLQWDGLQLPSASNPELSRNVWMFTWDPAQERIAARYYDDQNTIALTNSQSPDWDAQGNLDFEGNSILEGTIPLYSRDRLSMQDENHYTNEFFYQVEEEWLPGGGTTCERLF